MQGAMNTCVAIGAALSNLVAGFVAKQAGFRAGFMVLTALAVGALLFFWAVMPETKRRIGKFAVWPYLIDAGKRLVSQMAG
jgi:sugar phosphate permease